jgi:hypothetical protein
MTGAWRSRRRSRRSHDDHPGIHGFGGRVVLYVKHSWFLICRRMIAALFPVVGLLFTAFLSSENFCATSNLSRAAFLDGEFGEATAGAINTIQT